MFKKGDTVSSTLRQVELDGGKHWRARLGFFNANRSGGRDRHDRHSTRNCGGSLPSINYKCVVVSAVSELAIGLLDSVRCFQNLVHICYFPSKHEQAL